MKIIIIGPPGSGKTVLLHKIIRSNTNITFNFIIDSYEALGAGAENVFANVPGIANWIIATQTIENIPQNLRNNALILNVPQIRGGINL